MFGLINNYNLRKRKPASETCATPKRIRTVKTAKNEFDPAAVPAEIWSNVFGFLTSSKDLCAVSLTCKEWKAIAFAHPPPAWRKLVIQSSSWDMNNLRLPRYSKLELLEITHPFTPAIGLEIISRCCQNLRTLKLTTTEVTSASLRHLGLRCQKLQTLCVDNAQKVTDNGVKYIAAGCPNLRKFRLRNAKKITNRAFEYLGGNCHQIEVLTIEGCTITNKALEYLSRGCPKIHSLTLQFSQLTEQGLMQFCNREMNMVLVGCQDANMKKTLEGEWFFAGKRWISQQPDWGVDLWNN